MLTILNFLNAHILPIFQPILMILVSKSELGSITCKCNRLQLQLL